MDDHNVEAKLEGGLETHHRRCILEFALDDARDVEVVARYEADPETGELVEVFRLD